MPGKTNCQNQTDPKIYQTLKKNLVFSEKIIKNARMCPSRYYDFKKRL